MAKFDPKVTQAIQDWLNTPAPSRDIMAGAELMLSLNRNRALYNSIIKHPAKYSAKLVYELKKFLRLRLDNMAVADVVRLEERIMPSVSATLADAPVITTDDELPEGAVAKGRREDHDSLPAEIRDLWESNAARYQHIRLLFNELKAMHSAKPCDRYEKLVILEELDRTYRSNLEKYDSFVAPAPGETDAHDEEPSQDPALEIPAEDDATDVVTNNEKTINNARKTLSKYRKKLSELETDDPARAIALEKIQAAVSAILVCGAGVSDDTRDELMALGISFD